MDTTTWRHQAIQARGWSPISTLKSNNAGLSKKMARSLRIGHGNDNVARHQCELGSRCWRIWWLSGTPNLRSKKWVGSIGNTMPCGQLTAFLQILTWSIHPTWVDFAIKYFQDISWVMNFSPVHGQAMERPWPNGHPAQKKVADATGSTLHNNWRVFRTSRNRFSACCYFTFFVSLIDAVATILTCVGSDIRFHEDI